MGGPPRRRVSDYPVADRRRHWRHFRQRADERRPEAVLPARAAHRLHLLGDRRRARADRRDDGADLLLRGDLARDAQDSGYKPIAADALRILGELQSEAGHFRDAEKSLFDAVLLAEASRHDTSATLIWMHLAYLVGYRNANYPQAQSYLALAGAALERTGGIPTLAAELEQNKGILEFGEGMYEQALALKKEA